jgi:hypothetical protein
LSGVVTTAPGRERAQFGGKGVDLIGRLHFAFHLSRTPDPLGVPLDPDHGPVSRMWVFLTMYEQSIVNLTVIRAT